MGGGAVKPEDLHKLLGGYAAGTLTPREREELFRGALEDQALFDALVKEDTLRDLLSERGARAELLAALEERRGSLAWFGWLRRPAAALAAAGALAAAVLVLVTVPRPAGRVEMAKVEMPAPPGAQADRVAPWLPPPANEGEALKNDEPRTDVRARAIAPPPSPTRERDAAPPLPSVSGRAEPPEPNLAAAPKPVLPDQNQESPGAPLGAGPRAAAVGAQEMVRREAETRGEARMVSQTAPAQTAPEAVSQARAGAAPAGEVAEARDASPPFEARTAAVAEAVPMTEPLARKKAAPVSWRILAVSGDTVTLGLVPGQPLEAGARLSVWRGGARLGDLTVIRVSPSGVEARFKGSTQPRPGDSARPLDPAGGGYYR
jgi:hypothetical protein